METVEDVIVQPADAVSAARPGARRETLESYVKRLRTLETIGDAFPGVEKAYAVQAGREIRLMVRPEVVDDAAAGGADLLGPAAPTVPRRGLGLAAVACRCRGGHSTADPD